MQLAESGFSDRRFTAFVVFGILFLVAIRVAVFRSIPPGFYLDEAAGAAHAIALLRDGTDAWGTPHPLFSKSLGGGFTTSVYLYPVALWVKIFGTSEVAFRSFSFVCTLASILLLSLGVKMWLGKRDGILAALIALALPWNWVQASVAWDPAMVPLFIASAFLAYSYLWLEPTSPRRTLMLFAYPASLVLLAYVYPPARVTGAFFFVLSYYILWSRKRADLRVIASTVFVSALVSLPLLNFMLQPESLVRTQALSVFHDYSLLGGMARFFYQLLKQINPVYLFLTGDKNLRHATGVGGMLGFSALPSIVALVATAFPRFRSMVRTSNILGTNDLHLAAIGLVGFAVSLIVSSLTYGGQPQSLRSCSAWPFSVLFMVVGWKIIFYSEISMRLKRLSIAIFVASTCVILLDMVLAYPERTKSEFDVAERALIEAGKPPADYAKLALKYYQTR